jgi:ACS family hexuronate transporter-like MFS transporter
MKIKNFRWWIAALLMLATALNYLDRQNLPMVITELRKIFPIDNVTFSQLNFMFLLAYGLMSLCNFGRKNVD